MWKLYAYVANESTRLLVEDGMSRGLTNTRTARGFFVLYHVFARKQYILCSALRHKICLIYLMLHRFEIHFALELSRTALLGCRLAASRLRKAALRREESFNSVQFSLSCTKFLRGLFLERVRNFRLINAKKKYYLLTSFRFLKKAIYSKSTW